MRTLFLVAALCATAAQAVEPAPAFGTDGGTPAAAEAAPAPAPAAAAPGVPSFTPPADAMMGTDDFFVEEVTGCQRWKHAALMSGPVATGYSDADLGVGRHPCPVTAVGLGGRFSAIIDTPDFYGALGVDGLLWASFAFTDKIELFATLEAVQYQYAQNASLKGSQIVFGSLTAGGTYLLYEKDRLIGGVTARILFPTSFAYAGVRLVGVELGHNMSWRTNDWLEVHTWLGGDFTAGLSGAHSVPRVGGTLTAGLQLSPFDWAALVVDLTGRLGMDHSFLAPSVALRFRVFQVGIELGGTLPLVGNDRHDFIAGLRLGYAL